MRCVIKTRKHNIIVTDNNNNKIDFPVVKATVDELSSARIWRHKLCATLPAKVDINYRLPIKVYYRICTIIHIRIEIIHGSHAVL